MASLRCVYARGDLSPRQSEQLSHSRRRSSGRGGSTSSLVFVVALVDICVKLRGSSSSFRDEYSPSHEMTSYLLTIY